MRTQPLARFAAFAAAALLAGTACQHDSTGPKSTTDFRATVTGAVARTLTGEAFAQTIADVDGIEYDIALSDGPFESAEGGIILAHFGDAVTAATYVIGDFTGAADEFVALFESTTDGEEYFSTGGTLVIEQISQSRVKGHFDMTMQTDSTGREVHVTGTFDGANDGIPGSSSARTTWVPARDLPAARAARGGRASRAAR
jgi:hypothetical protein